VFLRSATYGISTNCLPNQFLVPSYGCLGRIIERRKLLIRFRHVTPVTLMVALYHSSVFRSVRNSRSFFTLGC